MSKPLLSTLSVAALLTLAACGDEGADAATDTADPQIVNENATAVMDDEIPRNGMVSADTGGIFEEENSGTSSASTNADPGSNIGKDKIDTNIARAYSRPAP